MSSHLWWEQRGLPKLAFWWLDIGIRHIGSNVCLLSYLHVTLLLVGTTKGCVFGFLTISCQWIVSAWHRNLFWSTYTPPLRISAEKQTETDRERTLSKQTHTLWLSEYFACFYLDDALTHPDTVYSMPELLTYFWTRWKWHLIITFFHLRVRLRSKHPIVWHTSNRSCEGNQNNAWPYWYDYNLWSYPSLFSSSFAQDGMSRYNMAWADIINYTLLWSQHKIQKGFKT